MNDFAVWIDDLLGAVKSNLSPDAAKLLESCGKGCASRRNAIEGMASLRAAVAHCENRSEIVAFLNERLPITFTEVTDGTIGHLGKDKCGCKMAPEISNNADVLCNCTRGHEKAIWNAFFGKPVDVEILETTLRGGGDCVSKILVSVRKSLGARKTASFLQSEQLAPSHLHPTGASKILNTVPRGLAVFD